MYGELNSRSEKAQKAVTAVKLLVLREDKTSPVSEMQLRSNQFIEGNRAKHA